MPSEYNLTSENIMKISVFVAMKISVFVAMKNRFECFFFLKKCSYNSNFLQEIYSGCECNQLSVNLPVILLQWPCFHVVLKLPMLMSFYVKALKLMLPKSLWLSHCNWPKKVKLLCGFPTLSWWKVNPLTPKISFIILLTVCHLALVMLVWRIWYWIN